MERIFIPLGTVLAAYRYPFVFLATIFEGPIVMLAGGLMLRLGNFSFPLLYLTLLLGDLTADTVWYWVGRGATEPFLRRFGHFFGITQEVFQKMKDVFHRHDIKILFISKITMGFGFAIPTIMAAGASKIPFKKFITFNFLGGIIWTGALIFVGYFFGNFYFLVADGFKILFVGALVIIFIAGMYGFLRFLKRRFNPWQI